MKEGWKIKPIGKIVSIINGGTPKSKVPEYWDGDVLWITPKDMGQLEDIYVSDTNRKITKLGLAKSSAKLIPANSVILSTRAPIGHLAINKEPMATNQGCRGLVPLPDVNTNFLFYFLSMNIPLLNDLGSGTTFKELAKSTLAGVKIPLPPIPEQERIVAILDEAFEGIATAVASAEKNLANARELFESYLNDVFTREGDGWEEKTFEDVCIIKPPKKEAKKRLAVTDLVSFVPMNDLGECNKGFPLNCDKPLADVAGSYTYFADNDVLLAKITPCFENGKLGIARNLTNGIGFGSSEFIVFRSKGQIDPDYLFYFLSRDSFRKEGARVMTGAVGHKRVPKKFIEQHPIPMPPLSEQSRLVMSLDALRAKTQRLEAIYQQKLASLADLKQSLLQKAFAGELTAKPETVIKHGAVA